MLRRTRRGTSPDVVADVRQQVEQAAALASIGGQDRLDDPRLNPAVRGLADQLRDERHRQLLRDAHRRGGRQIRVLDQRAEAAARALTLIQRAREATSPAQSVLALHNGRQRAMTAALGASIALMLGAATGVAALAESWGTHGAAGYVAEVGMTGLSTAAILVRSHLARHGYRVSGWQSRALWALAIVPMLASIAANAAAAGPIGIACSVGAAAFAGLAHLVADSYGDAIQARARQVSATDEAELRAVALGEDIAPAPAAPAVNDAPEGEGQVVIGRPVPEVRAEDAVQAYTDTGMAAIEAWLTRRDGDGDEGGRPAISPDPDPTPEPQAASAADGAEETPAHTVPAPAHIGGDQPARPVSAAARIERAHAARRAAGEETRRRVAAYLDEHPGARTGEIADALGLSPATVRRHRPRGSGGEVAAR